MATDPLLYPRRGYVPSLDGLRGVAMLAVVCCHLVWPSPTSRYDWIDRVLINGWIGVDLFFVLSGFLITGILLDRRDEPRYFTNFYARRALRIFPIYYLFLVGLFIWIPFVAWWRVEAPPWQYSQVYSHQAWYWTYTVNILEARSTFTDWFHTGHLWSLSVEEQFYLVWPALVLLIPARRLPLLCLVATAAAVLLRVWWVTTHDLLLGAYVLTPLRMDSLAIGAFVAALSRSASGTARLKRWYRPVGGAALAIALPIQIVFGHNLQHRWVVLVGYVVNSLVFAAIIVWLLDDERPGRPLERPWLRKIGQISYGGYLYHLPLIGLCASLRTRLIGFAGENPASITLAHAVWIGGMIALTIAVASLSYRWIETPFLELKDRFFAGSPRQPAAASQTGRLNEQDRRQAELSG